ncbi:MAG: AsmA-like C-terminal region-containing protein [Bacteroidales bacterium]
MQLTAKQKKIFKISAITLGSIVALFLIICLSIRLILTDKSLTKMVNKYSNEYLNAYVKVDTVSLALLSEFPYVGIKLVNGEIISRVFENECDSLKNILPSQADSLLSFKELVISLSLPQLLMSNIDIKRIKMVTPRAYAFVSPWGKANWDIIIADTTTTNNSSNFELNINVERINISDRAHIVYDSRPDSLMATVALNKLRLKGKLTLDKNKLIFDRGYFSKFSITVEHFLAQKNVSPVFYNLPDSITIKNEQIGGQIKKTTASFMIDSLNIISGKKGAFKLDALTHSNLKIGDIILAKDLPLEINGGFAFDTVGNNTVTLQGLKVTAAEVPLVLNGKIKITKDSLYTNNLCGRVDDFYLSSFFKYIPKQIFPNVNKIETDAKFTVDVDVNGSFNFNTGAIPSFIAQFNLPSSKIAIKGQKVGIKEMAVDVKAYYNAHKPDSNGVDIKQFLIDGVGIKVDSRGYIKNLTGDPYINMKFISAINLDTLGKIFPNNKNDFKIEGALQANVEVKSLLSNLAPYKLANAFVRGDIDSDNLNIQMPSKDFYCKVKNVCLKMGAEGNTTDSTIKMGTKMLALNFNVDSIYIRHTDSLVIRGKQVQVAGHNAASVLKGDKTKVHPFNGIITAKNFEVDGTDSSRLKFKDTKSIFSILPYKDNFAIPVIKVSSTNKHFMMRSNINRYTLEDGTITFEAIMDRSQDKALLARKNKILDSLQMVYPNIKRDSLIAYVIKLKKDKMDDFERKNVDFGVEDKNLAYFIREWNVKGAINAARGRVTTPYFPVKSTMHNINMSFTANDIVFNNTHFNLGESVIEATGKISGLRMAMLAGGNGKIKADFKINSDTLNFNELVYAASRGMEYIYKSDEYKKNLMGVRSEEKLQKAITASGTDTIKELDLIIIPANIDANIKLNVNYGKYSNLVLNKVEGELIAKDRCLQINGFKAITSAGEMDIDAFYATKSKKDIAAGFDLTMKNMNVKQLIALMPGIDSLLPMLTSFEGVFNCQIAATTKLDSKMNVIFPSMRGVARIKGENLVLMDGKTFAEISKMLRFKNRDRNVVDKISVEIMIKDNKIEVFPFIMQIDRYITAISGEQDLDMNFKYHISVLKSPIPIRLGVNVFGNLDDFDFKIGKAKYKNTNLPVYTQMIDDTRLNLRSYITNIFNRGVDAAIKNGAQVNKLDELRKKNAIENEPLEKLTAQDSLLLN